jgi:hypothetical protein
MEPVQGCDPGISAGVFCPVSAEIRITVFAVFRAPVLTLWAAQRALRFLGVTDRSNGATHDRI